MSSTVPSRRRRAAGALGVTLAVGATGLVFSAFTATTSNTGNQVSTGSVALSDTDGGSASLFDETSTGNGVMSASESRTNCIRVTYNGSVDSLVRLYSPDDLSAGANFNLTVTTGTGLSGSFPACTGFSADVDGGVVYDGALSAFPGSYAAPGAAGQDADGVDESGNPNWSDNESVDYQFVVTAPASGSGGESVGPWTFTWEAQSV